jgi:Pilus assembly protein, PilO
VTRRNSILLVAVAVVAAVGAYFMLALSPKRDEVAKLDQQIAKQQTALQAAEAEVANHERARENYRANYSTVAKLGKAVPVDDDVRSLMVQVNSAADRAGVDFRTISVGGGSNAAAALAADAKGAEAATPPPGATTVGSAGFSMMPFALNFKGSFFELGDFFSRLDRFVAVRGGNLDVTGRLLVLNSITLTPDPEKGFPNLTAEVSANGYLLPPTEGLTSGATAAGPAGSAGTGAAPAASATPAPSNPATTTTATATGVAR